MPKIGLLFILDSIETVFCNDNDTLRKELNLDFGLQVSPEKQVTFSVETPEVYQQINVTSVVHGARDFCVQVVAVKVLFMSEMYELKREINRLRENINKINNAGENNLYQEYKNYLEQQIFFLQQELSLKENSIDKLLEISSSQCKDINYSKEKGRKIIDIAKNKGRCRLRIQKFRRPSYNLQLH